MRRDAQREDGGQQRAPGGLRGARVIGANGVEDLAREGHRPRATPVAGREGHGGEVREGVQRPVDWPRVREGAEARLVDPVAVGVGAPRDLDEGVDAAGGVSQQRARAPRAVVAPVALGLGEGVGGVPVGGDDGVSVPRTADGEGGVEAPTVGAFDAGAEPLGREAPREGAGDVRGEVLEFRDAPGAAAQRDEIDPSRCVVADQRGALDPLRGGGGAPRREADELIERRVCARRVSLRGARDEQVVARCERHGR